MTRVNRVASNKPELDMVLPYASIVSLKSWHCCGKDKHRTCNRYIFHDNIVLSVLTVNTSESLQVSCVPQLS